MDQDDDPAGAAAAGPGPSAGVASPPRAVLGVPPDLWHGGDHERCTMFEPALYIQRYTTVCRLLADVQRCGVVTKVLDIGCSEMSFLQFLKSIPTLTDIALLDISEPTLRRYLHRASPAPRDRLDRRLHPLSVRVFCGDVTQPDTRLLGCEVVTGIEVIEHLEAPVLEALPAAVFGFLHPRLVVLTTPNAEFNQLFPGFSGMRHWDHKFEWTRAEFQHWCSGVVSRYPEYTVTYDGIGPPPAGSEHLGCCSQMAVFQRRDDPAAASAAAAAAAGAVGAAGVGGVENAVDVNAPPQHPHQLLTEQAFPFESREDRLFSDIMFYTRQLGQRRLEEADIPRREELVPLRELSALQSVVSSGARQEELVALLASRGVHVVMRAGEPHLVHRAPDDTSSEDELAGGDLRPADAAAARTVPMPPGAGADSAAGDATYHDDWDNEPDWEQEIMQRLRLGRTARPRPGVV